MSEKKQSHPEKLGVITPADLHLHSLKREVLLFDKIVVAPHQSPPQSYERRSEQESKERETTRSYLVEQGVLYDAMSLLDDRKAGDLVRRHFQMNNIAFDSFARPLLSDTLHFGPEHSAAVDNLQRRHQDESRFSLASALRAAGFDAVPLFHSSDAFRVEPSAARQFLAVLLDKLPIPDDTVPWECIIDFRQDKELRSKYHDLMRWMRRSVNQGWNKETTEEQLEHLLEVYRKHLKLRKLKYVFATFAVAYSLVEGVAKLPDIDGLTKLAGGFCTLAYLTIDLMSARHCAPGQEVAYIHDARKMFCAARQSRE